MLSYNFPSKQSVIFFILSLVNFKSENLLVNVKANNSFFKNDQIDLCKIINLLKNTTYLLK